eukprot:gene7027-9353_t
MKVNVVYAHPAADSYNASLHQRILKTLSARGDEVIDFDLYAMKFDPVMEEEEWRGQEAPLPPPQAASAAVDANSAVSNGVWTRSAGVGCAAVVDAPSVSS